MLITAPCRSASVTAWLHAVADGKTKPMVRKSVFIIAPFAPSFAKFPALICEAFVAFRTGRCVDARWRRRRRRRGRRRIGGHDRHPPVCDLIAMPFAAADQYPGPAGAAVHQDGARRFGAG